MRQPHVYGFLHEGRAGRGIPVSYTHLLIYNPARTRLLLDAAARGIRCENGLSMLVAQAKRAAELFTGRDIPDAACTDILRRMEAQMHNLILVGMPGSGKTTVGSLLAVSYTHLRSHGGGEVRAVLPAGLGAGIGHGSGADAMELTLPPVRISGTIEAIASKSQAHRLLLCAALADRTTRLTCAELSEDIQAMAFRQRAVA